MHNEYTELLLRLEDKLDTILRLLVTPFLGVCGEERPCPSAPLWPVRFPAYRPELRQGLFSFRNRLCTGVGEAAPCVPLFETGLHWGMPN